jgi:HAD superfamily hydrolase (TIGR01509 family)
VIIDAVVFDMDGLMLDTEPLYKQAWQSGCRELGYELTDGTYTTLVGRPTAACEQVLLDTFGSLFPLDDFRARWPARWRQLAMTHGIHIKPGLVPFLDLLRSRRILTAVATSSEAAFAEFSLGRAGLLDAFQAVVTGDQIERGKPSPDIYLEAAKRLGVDPMRCAAIEDSEAGAIAASSAGMVTLLVPDWVAPSAAARRAAHHVFASLGEAHAFLSARLDVTGSAGLIRGGNGV